MKRIFSPITAAAGALAVLLGGLALRAVVPAPYPTGPITFEKYTPQPAVILPGELLRYQFDWNGIPAAEATVQVKARAGREGWICVEAGGKIIGSAALLFRANDAVGSCLESKSMKPDSYSVRIRESLDHYDMTVNFNHAANRVERVKVSPRGRDEDWFEVSNAYCPVSAVMLVRSLDWAPGQERKFEVVDGHERYLVVVSAGEIEEITVPAGKFRAIRLAPSVFQMPGERQYETKEYWERRQRKDQEAISLIQSFTLWMDLDPPRPVLKIRTDVFFGHVDMELAEVSSPALSR